MLLPGWLQPGAPADGAVVAEAERQYPGPLGLLRAANGSVGADLGALVERAAGDMDPVLDLQNDSQVC